MGKKEQAPALAIFVQGSLSAVPIYISRFSNTNVARLTLMNGFGTTYVRVSASAASPRPALAPNTTSIGVSVRRSPESEGQAQGVVARG